VIRLQTTCKFLNAYLSTQCAELVESEAGVAETPERPGVSGWMGFLSPGWGKAMAVADTKYWLFSY